MVFLRQKKNLSNKFWKFTDVRLNVCSCNLNLNKAVEDIPILKKKYLAFSYSILRNSLYMAKDIISEIIYGRFVSNLLITHPSLLHEMVIECEFLTQRNQNFKWAFLIFFGVCELCSPWAFLPVDLCMQLTKGYSIYTGSVIELKHRIIKVVKHCLNSIRV